MVERFSEDDWIKIGFSLLKEDGSSALTIGNLCKRAERTTGSFYFHFQNMNGFIKALTSTWVSEFTDSITAINPSTHQRRDLLNLLVVRLDLELESGIRRLAERYGFIQTLVSQADSKRINWLSMLYEQTGNYSQQEASDLAEIEYAAFIGFRLVNPNLTASRSRELYEAFLSFTQRSS